MTNCGLPRVTKKKSDVWRNLRLYFSREWRNETFISEYSPGFYSGGLRAGTCLGLPCKYAINNGCGEYYAEPYRVAERCMVENV